jgi:hypothetical protein
MLRWFLLSTMACVGASPVAAQTARIASLEAAGTFNPDEARAAVRDLADQLIDNFVYPDVGKRYASALRAKLAAGGYDDFPSRRAFADALTADLLAVAPDGHLAVLAGRPQQQPVAVPGVAPEPTAPAMEQAGIIAPGIAYVRFNAFTGAPDILREFTAFLDRTAGAETLIVDMRSQRGGGLSEMDILLPRLFAKPATVMVMDMRASVAKAHGGLPFASLVPVKGPIEFARAEHRIVPVSPVSPWQRAKVYLLIAARTASAAEHMATVLKETDRATLVGETTAGAGNFGGGTDLPGGYAAFIPFGHSYFPGRSGWEGIGVKPTIAVAPERALFEVLVREGLTPGEAQSLSDSHKPTLPMTRRRPLRP